MRIVSVLKNFLNFCLKNDVEKIIIASSIAVYGANKENSEKRPFKEDDEPKERVYLYGKEKIEMEKKAKKFYEEKSRQKNNYFKISYCYWPLCSKIF
jgi:nucleoside-diphosphate-sugar epimerase